jgi:curved DNA-binding protein CbpA
MKPYQQQNYYELLELATTASAGEIHSAYKRAMELHDPASAAMYALADPAQIEDLHNLLLRARDTLIDRSLRADYDRSLGLPEADSAPKQLAMDEILWASSAPPPSPPPIELRGPSNGEPGAPEPYSAPALVSPETVEPEGTPLNGEPSPQVPVAPVPVRARPKEVPQNAEFNGELLRQIRETQGLSLVQVSERTRISVRHLENVEADRYDALPATVYLRGMVMNLARELKLDPIRVARSYLALVASAQAKQK